MSCLRCGICPPDPQGGLGMGNGKEPCQVKGASPSRPFLPCQQFGFIQTRHTRGKAGFIRNLITAPLRFIILQTLCAAASLPSAAGIAGRSLHAWWEGKSHCRTPTNIFTSPSSWSSALLGVKPPKLAPALGVSGQLEDGCAGVGEMGVQGSISSCLGTTRAAHLNLPRVNVQRSVRHCSSESHRSWL